MIGESLILPWGGRFTGGDGDAQTGESSSFLELRATASSPHWPTLLSRSLSTHRQVSVPPLSGCLRPYPSQKSTSCPMGKHISCLSTHSAPIPTFAHSSWAFTCSVHRHAVGDQSSTDRAVPRTSSQKKSPALASRTGSQPSSWRMAFACPFTTGSSTPGRV